MICALRFRVFVEHAVDVGLRLVSVITTMAALLTFTLVTYLPHHVAFLRERASFYLSGQGEVNGDLLSFREEL